MNRTLTILLLVLLMATGINLWAQQKTVGKQPGKAKAKKKIFEPTVYLGNSDYKGGQIDKKRFDELLKQGLTSHDSLGNKYRVTEFYLSFDEHKVYEDSIGNLKMFTDFSSEYCPGDTITHDMAVSHGDTTDMPDMTFSIYQRIRPGDTVFFDHISVEQVGHNSLLSIPDSVAIEGRGMKCVIVQPQDTSTGGQLKVN